MNPVTYDILTQRVKQLGNLPAMPAILGTLTTALSMPAGKIDLENTSETIAYDKSLTAQVLRLATPHCSVKGETLLPFAKPSSLLVSGAFATSSFPEAFQ